MREKSSGIEQMDILLSQKEASVIIGAASLSPCATSNHDNSFLLSSQNKVEPILKKHSDFCPAVFISCAISNKATGYLEEKIAAMSCWKSADLKSSASVIQTSPAGFDYKYYKLQICSRCISKMSRALLEFWRSILVPFLNKGFLNVLLINPFFKKKTSFQE